MTEDKTKTNALQKMADAKQSLSKDDEMLKILRLVNRSAGAFHQAEKFSIISLAEQYEIIIQQKQLGHWKKLGYSKFSDFCEKEMDISQKKAYEILKMSRDLGQEFFLAGTKIGLKRHTFLALAKHKEEIQIDTQGDVPKIIYLDEEIPADDYPRIQQLVKDFEKKDEELLETKKQIADLKREITDLSEYQSKINEVKVQVISYGNQFKKLREYAKNDREKYNALVREIHSLIAWITELSDEILDETQEEADDQNELDPDDFNEPSSSNN